MLFDNVLSQVAKIVQSIVKNVEKRFKAWTEPSSDSMIGECEGQFTHPSLIFSARPA